VKETKIRYKKVKLNDPILIVGLPGIGSVGNLVGENLRITLKAKKFATLHSPSFPYQIIMLNEGKFRLVSNRFYYAKRKKGSNDIVLLLGDAQPLTPEGQYDVNERIVEFFKMLGGRQVYTIGGYTLGAQYVKKPRVFGLATDLETREYIKKQGVTLTNATGMSVLGSAGMIVAFSRKHKLKAACLMGETGMLDVDANSAKAVLEVLGKMLGIEVDMSNIEKLKEATEKMIKEIEDASRGVLPLPGAGPSHKESPNYIR